MIDTLSQAQQLAESLRFAGDALRCEDHGHAGPVGSEQDCTDCGKRSSLKLR